MIFIDESTVFIYDGAAVDLRQGQMLIVARVGNPSAVNLLDNANTILAIRPMRGTSWNISFQICIICFGFFFSNSLNIIRFILQTNLACQRIPST